MTMCKVAITAWLANEDAAEEYRMKYLNTPLNCAKVLKSFMHDFVSLIQSRQNRYLSIKFEMLHSIHFLKNRNEWYLIIMYLYI